MREVAEVALLLVDEADWEDLLLADVLELLDLDEALLEEADDRLLDTELGGAVEARSEPRAGCTSHQSR